MEGFEDPFNRRTFPWGKEDVELVAWFTELGRQRKSSAPLRRGQLCWGTCEGSLLSFARRGEGGSAGVAVNRGEMEMLAALPWTGQAARDLDTGRRYLVVDGVLRFKVPPMGVLRLESCPVTK